MPNEWWEERGRPWWEERGRDTVRAIVGAGSVLLLAIAASGSFGRKKVFVSFAVEDKGSREHLRGQSINSRSPFAFIDMGLDKPFSEKWKTQCRDVIRSCDGVIVLLSKKTWNAKGARWEIKCAVDEGKPILGVHIHKDNKGAIPPELPKERVGEWTWERIEKFIDSL